MLRMLCLSVYSKMAKGFCGFSEALLAAGRQQLSAEGQLLFVFIVFIIPFCFLYFQCFDIWGLAEI